MIVKNITKLVIICASVFMMVGCRQADRVNYNIRKDADNFNVRRRVVAINTRTNESLFVVEGLLSFTIREG